jgi:hypothetical protein
MDDDKFNRSNGPAKSPLFRVGRNSRGDWVVQDDSGRYGGIFVERSEAVKYALFENGHHQQAVMVIPEIIELDMGRSCSRNSAGVRN